MDGPLQAFAVSPTFKVISKTITTKTVKAAPEI
jgi:hypothetical protein